LLDARSQLLVTTLRLNAAAFESAGSFFVIRSSASIKRTVPIDARQPRRSVESAYSIEATKETAMLRAPISMLLFALAVSSAPALAANETATTSAAAAPPATLSCVDASASQDIATVQAQTVATAQTQAPDRKEAATGPKVVFQLNSAEDAPTILRFVTNYLAVEPTAQVDVVGYAGGVDFMLQGAKDTNGKPYAEQMAALAARGVAFKVCNNTLKARNLTAAAVSPPAVVVPGAVNEIIRLQTKEGYAYFRH